MYTQYVWETGMGDANEPRQAHMLSSNPTDADFRPMLQVYAFMYLAHSHVSIPTTAHKIDHTAHHLLDGSARGLKDFLSSLPTVIQH